MIFGHLWRRFDRLRANLVNSGAISAQVCAMLAIPLAVSTNIRWMLPTLEHFQPMFDSVCRFWGDFSCCASNRIGPNLVKGAEIGQKLAELGQIGSNVGRCSVPGGNLRNCQQIMGN